MYLKSLNKFNISLEDETNTEELSTPDQEQPKSGDEDDPIKDQPDVQPKEDKQPTEQPKKEEATQPTEGEKQPEGETKTEAQPQQSNEPKPVSYDKIVNANSPTVVISAYPTLGKSSYTNNHDDCLDLESSIYSKKVDGSKNEDFPKNYIDVLQYHLINNNWKYIFVASHKETRDALKAAGIKFYTLYPLPDKKQEVLDCCKVRGNTPEFIKVIEDNYDEWTTEMSKEPLSYGLSQGEFISDELFDTKLKFLKR